MLEENELGDWSSPYHAVDLDVGSAHATVLADDGFRHEAKRPLSTGLVFTGNEYDVVFLNGTLVRSPLASRL